MKTPRIVIAGGGTAGTFAPLLAVREEIQKQLPAAEWMFIGTNQGPERAMAEAAGIPFRAIPAGKLRRYWSWENFRDLGRTWTGYQAARKLLQPWKPSLVLSAGAYVSVPVVMAAKQLGAKILLHQQDVRPGLSNRLLQRFANRITVTFEKSLSAFKTGQAEVTGNPVRENVLHGSVERARKQFSLSSKPPVLLILGGSSGSQYINRLIGGAGFRLVQDWQILHITGPEREFVELQDERYHRFSFLGWEMADALAVAEVVVTRAGLGTMSELAALSKAAIFIPMPDTHQEDNAQLIDRLKAGLVFDQKTGTTEEFLAMLHTLRTDHERRRQYGHNIHQFYQPDAAERIAKAAIALLP